MPQPLDPEQDGDRRPRDLGEITLDRLLGTPSPISLDPPPPDGDEARLPFWTRVYLRVLGVSSATDESPAPSWRDHLVDSLIFAAIVVLLIWIGYLTYRAFAFLMAR
jgi:hypothetical protein